MKYSFHTKLALLFFTIVALFPTILYSAPLSEEGPQQKEQVAHITDHLIDDNYLILGLNVQAIETDEIVESYTTPYGDFVSLEQLVDVLDFKIAFDPNSHDAQGWFIKEEFAFTLNFANKTINSKGKNIKLNPEDIIIHYNEVYINSKMLEKILDIAVKIDLGKLQILIKSRHTLPIKKKYELLARKNRLSSKKPGEQQKKLKSNYTSDKYSIFSMPELQVSLKTKATESTDEEIHKTFKENTEFSAIMAHDLAWMSNNLFISGDRRETQQFRTKAFRLSNRNDLLGPLKASQIYAGDLSEVAGDGAGVRISNDPIDKPATFNTVIISGDSTPGWTVELYRGKTLLEVVTIGDDGRYIFRDLKLAFKQNVFEIIEYGPHGEVKKKFVRYNLNRNFINDDKFYYDAHFINEGQTLIDKQKENTVSNHLNHIKFGKKIFDYLTFNVENENYSDDERRYNQIYSFFTIAKNSLLRYQASTDKSNHGLNHVLSATQEEEIFGKSNLTLGYGEGYNETRSFEFDFERDIKLGPIEDITIVTENKITETNSESSYKSVYNLTKEFSFVYLNSKFDVETNQTTDIENRTIFNKKVKQFQNSLILNSIIEPTTRLTSATLNNNFRKKIYKDYNFNLSYSSTFPVDANSTYNIKASLFREIKKIFSYGVSTNYDREEEFSFSIDLSLKSNASLFQEPLTKKPILTTDYSIDKPLISVRSYIDNNDNNQYDKDLDETLEGVKYRFTGTYSKKPGNKDGITIGGNLSDGQIYEVAPDVSSMEDQTITPKIEFISVMPRTGNIVALNFPFMRIGSIDGNLFNNKEPVHRAKVILYNEKHEELKSFVTSDDGYFFFPDIPLGKYYIALSETSRTRFAMTKDPHFPVTIDSENLFIEYLSYDIAKYSSASKEVVTTEDDSAKETIISDNIDTLTTTPSSAEPIIEKTFTIITTDKDPIGPVEKIFIANDANPAENQNWDSLVTKEGFYEVELASSKYKADLEKLNILFKEQAVHLFKNKDSTIKLIDPNNNKEIFYVLKVDNFLYQHNAEYMCDEIEEEFDIKCQVDLELSFKKEFLSKENVKTYFDYVKNCNAEYFEEEDYYFINKKSRPGVGVNYKMTIMSYKNTQENFEKICQAQREKGANCSVKPVIRLSESLNEANYKDKFEKISKMLEEYAVFTDESEYDASNPSDSELYKLRIGKFSDLNSAHDFCNKMLLNGDQCIPVRRVENTEQMEFDLSDTE